MIMIVTPVSIQLYFHVASSSAFINDLIKDFIKDFINDMTVDDSPARDIYIFQNVAAKRCSYKALIT